MDPSLHLHLPAKSFGLTSTTCIPAAAPDDDDLSIWLFDYWLVDIHSFSCSYFFK
jgi:hypothetical protein